MIDQACRTASKLGHSSLAFISTFALLYPIHRAAAQDGAVSIPVPDMLLDFVQCLPLAILVAIIVEVVRLCVPWLSRKKGSNDAQKIVLRVLSVLVGTAFGFHGNASLMGDGTDPRLLGGIASGAVAALFGGQLIVLVGHILGAVFDRVKALRSKP
jgi:hypothetical protein